MESPEKIETSIGWWAQQLDIVISVPFLAVILLAIVVIWRVFAWLYKHNLDALRDQRDNLNSIVRLNEATIALLKVEIDNLQKTGIKEREVPEKILPVVTGNTAIQTLSVQLRNGRTVKLPTHPTDSSVWKHFIFSLHGDQYEELAAARRLVESGLAKVEEPTAGTYTLSASDTTANYDKLLDEYVSFYIKTTSGKKKDR